MISPESKPETRLKGIGVSPGIAIGPAERLGKTLEEPEHLYIEAAQVAGETSA